MVSGGLALVEIRWEALENRFVFAGIKFGELEFPQYRGPNNTWIFFQISNPIFPAKFPADFDDIKTVNGHDSDPQTVLISSKSAGKIGQKIGFEI